MKQAVFALAVVAAQFLSGCNCTSTDSGVAVSPNKYAVQRDAACAAVDGCSAEFLASVRVYEVSSASEAKELCEDEKAWACYCPGVGCHTIILMPDDRGNAAHEYVHAALDSAGIKLDHGPTFEAALKKTRELLSAK
ncbi:MAG TPA: hypothetical protein VFN67_04230 [Polyangiales bacterium]|nr:hypothetical protein [Polyangiales bacterium]